MLDFFWGVPLLRLVGLNVQFLSKSLFDRIKLDGRKIVKYIYDGQSQFEQRRYFNLTPRTKLNNKNRRAFLNPDA